MGQCTRATKELSSLSFKPNSDVVCAKKSPAAFQSQSLPPLCRTESYTHICNFIYIAPYFVCVCVCLFVSRHRLPVLWSWWCFIIAVLLTPSNIPCPKKGSKHFCSNAKLSKLSKLSKCPTTYIHIFVLADITHKGICYILCLKKRFLMWPLMCLRKGRCSLIEYYHQHFNSSVTFCYMLLRHELVIVTLYLCCLLSAKFAACHWLFVEIFLLQNRPGPGGVNNILLPKGLPPLSLWGPPLLGSPCPPPEERYLSMPETGEKERNYLFKSYTDLRVMT